VVQWSPSAGRRNLCALSAVAVAVLAWAVPASASAGTVRPHSGTTRPAGQNASSRSLRRQSAAGLGVFTPSFHCEKPGHTHTVTVAVDFSDVKVTHTYKPKKKLELTISGKPEFSLSLDFQGTVECTAKVLATVPLGESGLELEIGPKLKFTADGDVGANFTWQPTIEFGFTLDKDGFTDITHKFANGGGIDFTGKGKASLQLALDAVVETEGAVAGIEGVVGPTITGKVSVDSKAGTTCWSGDVETTADFHAFVHVFKFVDAKVGTGELKLGKTKKLGGGCLGTITFDGSPGTGAPPATLGPYTMQAFPADPTAEDTVETSITGPTGTVSFDSGLTHYLVGSGWATWSNGYTGDVYADFAAQSDGDFVVTVTLPPGTGAFYAYGEPNLFEDFSLSAYAQDGPRSGPLTVYGDAGAQYFGFYATCGHTIKSITFTDSGGDSAMAIGEFGIAPKLACPAA